MSVVSILNKHIAKILKLFLSGSKNKSFQALEKALEELLSLQPPLNCGILFVYELKNQLNFCV